MKVGGRNWVVTGSSNPEVECPLSSPMQSAKSSRQRGCPAEGSRRLPAGTGHGAQESLGPIGRLVTAQTSSQTSSQRPRRDEARTRRASQVSDFLMKFWLRGQDLNLRPLGYEPNELPDCSTPRSHHSNHAYQRQRSLKTDTSNFAWFS